MFIDHHIQRKLYAQTGNFFFYANILPSVVSGVHNFGFSGAQNTNSIGFQLASGHVADWNSQFVSVYDANNLFIPIKISGVVGANSVDYYINDKPVGFGVPRQTGVLDYIYANSEYGSMNIELYINGDIPSYTLPNFVPFSTGASSVPITFQNYSDFPFTLFSGALKGRNDRFSISGQTTGVVSNSLTFYLIPSGKASVGTNVLPVSFSTDFGNINTTITMSGQTDPFSGLFIEIIGPNSIVQNTSGVYSINFNNIGSPIAVLPYLQYITGVGSTTTVFEITGSYFTTGTGFINYSGDVSANISVTGSGYSGAAQQIFSGMINTSVLSFQWATGVQISSLLIPATGNSTGVNYTGLSSGLINIITSGIIEDGSGYYHGTGWFNDIPISSFSLYPTGTVQATGAIYYNSPVDSDVVWIHNPNIAIIKGYHYNTINELNDFINNNTGVHFTSGNVIGSTIYLTSLLSGAIGNNSILEINDLNIGDMEVSNPTLIGGLSFGLNNPTTPTTNFTGYLDQDINGTGIYSQVLSGGITELRSGIDIYKQFTGVWNLYTGASNPANYNYRASGWLSPSQETYIYEDGKIVAQAANFYVNITYNNLGGSPDLAILYVSGFKTNHAASKIISGVRS